VTPCFAALQRRQDKTICKFGMAHALIIVPCIALIVCADARDRRAVRTCTQLLQNAESASPLEQDKGVHRQRFDLFLRLRKRPVP
jgi:hypothetical protein